MLMLTQDLIRSFSFCLFINIVELPVLWFSMNRQLCGVMRCLLKWTKIFRQLSNQSYICLCAHFNFLFISKTLNLAGLLRYKDKHDHVWEIVVINSDPQYDWLKREFLLEFNIELTQNRKKTTSLFKLNQI